GRVLLDGGTVHAWRDEKGAINLLELMAPAGGASPADGTEPKVAGNDAAGTDGANSDAAVTAPRATTAPATPATAPATTAPSAPPSRWVVAAPDLAVKNLRIELQDRLLRPGAAFTLAPLNVNVRGYSTAPGTA